MRRGGRLFILLGVGLALVAVLLAVMSFSGGGDKKPTPAADQTVTITVIQATRDIPANTVIRQDDIKSVEIQKSSAASGAAADSSQVVGLATNGSVVKGQQILMANLVSPGLTSLLTDGKRAAALPVDRVSALGGLIRADDYVDIIYSVRVDLTGVLPTNIVEAKQGDATYTFKDGELQVPTADQPAPTDYPYPGEAGSRFLVTDDGSGNPITKVILQNVRVLRVIAGNQSVNDPSSAEPTATSDTGTATTSSSNADTSLPNADMLVLEVDPQQAELIKFLQDNSGKYQVVLRSPNDHATSDTTGVTYDQLMSNYGLPAPKTVRLPGGGQ
ncbi:MAG: Flp pilus assembly protein CpaB [Nitrolancea sp.]